MSRFGSLGIKEGILAAQEPTRLNQITQILCRVVTVLFDDLLTLFFILNALNSLETTDDRTVPESFL